MIPVLPARFLTRNDPGPNDESSYSEAAAAIFFALQLAALGGAVIILLTVTISSTIKKRHPIWLNFMISWIISCVSYSLLVGWPVHEPPPRGLCFAQAVLIYTVPSMTATATTALVIYVLITVRSVILDHSQSYTVYTILTVGAPYVPAIGMAALSLVVGLKDPSTIGRTDGGMYCNMDNKLPGKVSAILTAVLMLCCLGLEIVICFILRRNWVILRSTPWSTSMSIRVLSFGLFGIVAIVVSLIFFLTEDRSKALNIIIALVPVAAVCIFGTQEDILQTWKGWITGRKPQRPRSAVLTLLPAAQGSQEPMMRTDNHSFGESRSNI